MGLASKGGAPEAGGGTQPELFHRAPVVWRDADTWAVTRRDWRRYGGQWNSIRWGPRRITNLCLSLYLTRHYDQAIQHCRQARTCFPDTDAVYLPGICVRGQKEYPEAIALLEKAMR